jgi:hypothetical protein
MFDGPAILDKAWEIEGASALSKIAKHAIQICSRLVDDLPMEGIIASDARRDAGIYWRKFFPANRFLSDRKLLPGSSRFVAQSTTAFQNK